MKDGIERAYKTERPRLIGWMSARIGREEAEDALHDIVVRSLVNLDSLECVRDVTAWLWACASRAVIDAWRKRSRRRETVSGGDPEELERVADDRTPGAEAEMERDETLAELARAITRLPAEQREVIVAQCLNGESFRSMSERTGIPADTLAGRKRYALERLRADLAEPQGGKDHERRKTMA